MSIDTIYRNYDSGSSSDPWSSYGLPSGGGYGDSSYYQAYEQQLLSYIQSLKTQLSTLQAGTPDYEMAIQYMNTAMSYLQQIDPAMASDPSLAGGWDPTSGTYGSTSTPTDPSSLTDPNAVAGVSGSTATPVNSFPITYQDSTHIVTDTGDTSSITVDENDPETRTIDAYQKDNTLLIPSNSASVNVQAQADDAVPGATMMVVTVTFPTTGVTRTIKYHNADRDDFKLDLQPQDKSQVTLDASLSSSEFANKVTINQADELANMQGTPPDETDPDTRTWNKNDAVDYYATEGTETDEIYAQTVNITLPDRSCSAKVTKTDDHEYTVEVYNSDNELIRTIHLHQVDGEGCINFNSLAAENLQYKDATSGSSADFHAWDDTSCKPDSFITVNGQAGGALSGPLDPNNPDDSVPSSIDGSTATYNKDEDISLHVYPDDDVNEHDISAGGTVDLYPNTQSDTAEVSYDADSGMLVIVIKTTDSNGKTEKETFKVDASMADKINLHLDTSKITYDGDIPSDIAKKVKDSNGNLASDSMAQDELMNNDVIKQLMKDNNYTADQVQAAMDDAGLTADDFTTPLSYASDVMEKMVKFMEELDPDLKKTLDNAEVLKSDNPANASSIAEATSKVYSALSELGYSDLKTWSQGSFPAQIFYSYAETAGLMKIDGHIFNLFDSSGKLNLSTWECVDMSKPHAMIEPSTGAAMNHGDGPCYIWWDGNSWQGDRDLNDANDEAASGDDGSTDVSGVWYGSGDPNTDQSEW